MTGSPASDVALTDQATKRIVALLSAAAVLVFNTASIVAMLRNYAADKDFIYGLDIKMLDEARRQKG